MPSFGRHAQNTNTNGFVAIYGIAEADAAALGIRSATPPPPAISLLGMT